MTNNVLTVPDQQEVHHYYHYEPAPSRVSVKIERNSRSINFEVAVSDAGSEQEAIKRAMAMFSELSAAFPQQEAK